MCGWMDVMAKSAEANRELQLDHSPAVVYVPERALSAEKTEKTLAVERMATTKWYDKRKESAGTDRPTRRTDPQGHRVGCLLATGSRRVMLGVHQILFPSRKVSFSNVATESVMGVREKKSHVRAQRASNTNAHDSDVIS